MRKRMMSMRKRIAIGAALVIGVAAYVLSQPKEGTVEYHKTRFLVGMKKAAGETRWDKALRFVNRKIGSGLQTRPDYVELEKQIDGDYEALLQLGFLVTRYYVFTNSALNIDAPWINEVYLAIPEERMYLSRFGEADVGSNVLFVTAPPPDIPIWEKFISQADVPESR
jgi:hypothetical protein